MNEVITLVSTVGFPAAMCLLMGWYIYKREEGHTKEMAELRKTINNNTNAINRLVGKLEGQ